MVIAKLDKLLVISMEVTYHFFYWDLPVYFAYPIITNLYLFVAVNFQEECEKKGTPQERRPFDRERDLEAPRNLVTPAKRAALTKDSKTSLDSRFQRGSHSFL